MKTDAAFFELLETNPNRLAELIQQELPPFKSASSRAHKKTQEVRGDFVLEPEDPLKPLWIAEFQLYFDHSSFIRAEQSRAAVWSSENKRDDCRLKTYVPREVKGLIIFGNEAHLPPNLNTHPEIEFLVLEDLIKELRTKQPDSPLIALLAPLVDSSSELEKKAAKYYDIIRQSPNMEKAERDVMMKIFFHFITQVFPNLNTKQFKDMIAELTPFEETEVGKELINKGREEGLEEGREEGREEGLETALITVAQTKFAQLTEQHEKAIRALNEAQLNKLAASLVNFGNLVELEQWLNDQK